ncbi:hypothetical protein BC831DRAFT_472065 [Entophlyctis helioformis]|nr:hypothetical protein BC831DRAFT_472065 [Entophlyctis helioformis]
MLSTPSKPAASALLQQTPLRSANSLVAELRRQLRDAHQALDDRDRDIALAAEIGQSLLESNELLKQEYERVLAQTASSSSSADRLKDLEVAHIDLQSRHEALLLDHKRLSESERQARASIQRLDRANDQLQLTVQDLEAKVQEAEADRRRALKDRSNALAAAQAIQAEHDDGSSLVHKVLERAERAEAQLEVIGASWQDMESRCESQAEQIDHLSLRCTELQELLEESRAYRDEAEDQQHRADQLELELEVMRERLGAVQARLAVLEPESQSGHVDMGSKTLLSEVEDQRQALESQNTDLSENLVQLRIRSLKRERHMKGQMSSLRQMAHKQSSEERSKLLVDALEVSNSRCAELEQRVILLERQLDEARMLEQQDGPNFLLNGIDGYSDSNTDKAGASVSLAAQVAGLNEYIQALRLRIEQADNENKSLRREMQTLQLLRGNDRDQSTKLRVELGERSAELEQIRAMFANLQFEMEELRLGGVTQTAPQVPVVCAASVQTNNLSCVCQLDRIVPPEAPNEEQIPVQEQLATDDQQPIALDQPPPPVLQDAETVPDAPPVCDADAKQSPVPEPESERAAQPQHQRQQPHMRRTVVDRSNVVQVNECPQQ